MSEELTPEKVFEAGRQFQEALLANLTVEERLAGLEPEEVLSRYKPEEVLSRYKPEERLEGLKPEERLAGLEAYLAKQQQQAAQQSLVRTLHRLVQARFGLSAESLAPFQERWQRLGVAALEQLSEAVVQAESLADFEQTLNQLEATEAID